jgi:iron complex transport system substrate-binding protein
MRRSSFSLFFWVSLVSLGFSFLFPLDSFAQDSPLDKKTKENPSLDLPFQAVDVLGRSVGLSGKAQRIISLSPAVTEILFAIGAGDSVVGGTDFCDYPPEAKQKPSVGGFSGNTVSVERIVSLKPDLVILSAEMHGKIIDILDRLSIPSFAMEPQTFAQVYQDIRTLGRLTGHIGNAERVVKTMREKIDAVQRRFASERRVSVFWELWDDPLMTTGSSTFINEAISLAGGKNIFDDLTERWPTVSLEQILLRKPEWILSATDHGDRVNLQAITKRSGWSGIPAIRQGHVGLIDSDSISRGGPRLADAVEAIADLIHRKP